MWVGEAAAESASGQVGKPQMQSKVQEADAPGVG